MDSKTKKCRCELEWRKEKAMLEQQVEFMGLQVKELKIREDNYKKFNDAILGMYNTLQFGKQNSKVFKDIQLSIEQYSQELMEQKQKNSETLNQLDQENRELKQKCAKLEQHIAEITQNYEKQMNQIEIKLENINSFKIKSHEDCLKTQIEELNRIIEQKNQEIQEMEAKYEKKIQQIKSEQEIQFNEKMEYYNQLYTREREEILQKLAYQSGPCIENFKKSVSEHNPKSSYEKMQLVKNQQHQQQQQQQIQTQAQLINQQNIGQNNNENNQNQENISNISQFQSKSSEQKLGCIVTARLRATRSKTNLNTKINKVIDDNDQQMKREEMSISQFTNVSHINCKNSNVMEVNTQQLLKSSDILQMFGNDTIKQDAQSQNQIKMLLFQLQKEKICIENQISELENLSPGSTNLISERKLLAEKLKLITKELKRTKEEVKSQNNSDPQQNEILKHEITFMINKLVKAKGKLTESFVSSSSMNLSTFCLKEQTNNENNNNCQQSLGHIKNISKSNNKMNQNTTNKNIYDLQVRSIDGFHHIMKRHGDRKF